VSILFLILPLISAFLAPLGTLVRKRFGNILNLLIYGAGVVLGVSLYSTGGNVIVLGGWEPPYGINLYMSPLSTVLGTLMYGVAFLLHVYDLDRRRLGRYNLLFSLFVFSSLGMVMTGDLFNLFIFVEIGSIAVIALSSAVSMKAGSRGALKYMVPSAVLSMLMLAGIALVYATLGTLNIAHIAAGDALRGPLAFVIGIGILLIFLFETELFPFNSWVPDLYKGSASSFAAAIAGVGGLAGAGALARVFLTMMGDTTAFANARDGLALTLFWIAGASVLIGEVAALREGDLKKVLGFSTVGQMGIVVMTFASGFENAVFAGLFLLVNHSLVKPMMLMIAGFFVGVSGKADWDGMAGIGRRYPVLAVLFVLGGLSLMGMPLFAGFWGKLVLLRAYFESGSPVGFVGSGIVLVSVIIEGIYLLRIGHRLFERGEESQASGEEERLPVLPPKPRVSLGLAAVPSLLLVLGTLYLGLRPGSVAPFLTAVSKDLLNSVGYVGRVLAAFTGGGS
jgi:formate hydrogenlyase subunit 3/multisubunit Na+/H+ antiporter MnhD subunit